MRVLIIEDDKELSLVMKKGLEKYGFTIDIANEGETGEEKAYVNSYDTILLDLNLPDKDGLEILNDLRNNDILSPIIIVTARNEVEQRAKGLDLGADDYIIKPFDFIELRARIQAVIRRYYGRVNLDINVGKLKIDPKPRTVHYGSKEIVLSAKEFDILEYIGTRHPEVVSSEDIAEHIYDEFFNPFSSVLRVHMANLRKKLNRCSGEELLITVKGKGYKLWEED